MRVVTENSRKISHTRRRRFRASAVAKLSKLVKKEMDKNAPHLGATEDDAEAIIKSVMYAITGGLERHHHARAGDYHFQCHTSPPMIVAKKNRNSSASTMHIVEPSAEVSVEVVGVSLSKLIPWSFSPPRRPKGRIMQHVETDSDTEDSSNRI